MKLPSMTVPYKPALLFAAIALLLSGCSSDWGWYVVNPTTKTGMTNLSFLFSGLYYTILLSVTAIVISVIVGLLITLPGLSKNPML